MADMLFVLTPPRSFSSVVSTMIGQHPQMYGYPELHLFFADTLGEILGRERARGRMLGPPGLLRTLAELGFGGQTEAGLAEAQAWIQAHQDWTGAEVFRHVIALTEQAVGPRLLVEKSPGICTDRAALARQEQAFPQARYLHLTRHPVSNRSSWLEFREQRRQRRGLGGGPGRGGRAQADPYLLWLEAHRTLLDFTEGLAPERVLRMKGEDLLSDPDRHLPSVAAWLGLRGDAEAIAAMKRPEDSPYAFPGPRGAKGGNDGKFLRSPALRPGRVAEPDLAAALDADPGALTPTDREALVALADRLGYR